LRSQFAMFHKNSVVKQNVDNLHQKSRRANKGMNHGI
jgi:hypothetical protein